MNPWPVSSPVLPTFPITKIYHVIALYREGGPPLEFADRVMTAMPFPLFQDTGAIEMSACVQKDR